MRSFLTICIAAATLAAGSALAQAPVSIRYVRVGAADAQQAARFYEQVFGMKEVRRNARPGLLEIILNFGATTEEATAAPGARVAIIQRPANPPADSVSNIVLNVADMAAVLARVPAAGGTVNTPAHVSPNSGSILAMVRDPAGNRIELAQPPR